MKKKITTITFLMLFSVNVNATFPLVDSPWIAASILGNIQKLKNMYEKLEDFDLKLLIKRELEKQKQDAFNAAAARFVQEKNKLASQRHSDNLQEQMTSAPTVCGQLVSAANRDSNDCANRAALRGGVSNLSYAGYIADSDAIRNQESAKLLQRIEEDFPSLFGVAPDPESNDSGASSEASVAPLAYSLDASPLMSRHETFFALDKHSYDAMTDLISLIVPHPSMRSDDFNFDIMTDEDLAHAMSKESKRFIADKSLHSTLSLRSSAYSLWSDLLGQEAPLNALSSRLLEMHEAVSSGISETALTKLSKGETSTPTALYRSQVMAKVDQLDIQLEKFKSGLRQEAITAIRLADKVD